MYQTFHSESKRENEEKLIPKEIKEERKEIICTKKESTSFLKGIENEDLIIIAILFLLFYEDCKDNMLIILLAILLFLNEK